MPEKGKWKLTVRAEFAAAHCLRNYGGKCEATHGHNFGVELCVSGDRLAPDTDILVDFTVLKRDLKDVLELLDHKHLNEVTPFDTVNPSSENLARFIYRAVRPRVEDAGARMESVTVSERAAQSATYWEE